MWNAGSTVLTLAYVFYPIITVTLSNPISNCHVVRPCDVVKRELRLRNVYEISDQRNKTFELTPPPPSNKKYLAIKYWTNCLVLNIYSYLDSFFSQQSIPNTYFVNVIFVYKQIIGKRDIFEHDLTSGIMSILYFVRLFVSREQHLQFNV